MHDLDRKNRCQKILPSGQCLRDAQVGRTYCMRCSPAGGDRNAEQNYRLYQLLKAEDREGVERFDQREFQSLQVELAMVRVLIEEHLNLRHGRTDLLQVYGPLNTLFLTVEKLNTAIVQLEESLESLMSRPTLLSFGNELIKILQEELKDIPDSQNITERLSYQIILTISKAGQETSELTKTFNKSRCLYRLLNSKYQQRLVSFLEHEDAKHLREEIAIARMLLEERLNRIQSDSDFLASTGMINSQLLILLQLVQSTYKVEQKLGSLLTKPTLLTIGNKLITAIIDELKTLENCETLVDRICNRVIKTTEQMIQ